MAMVVFLHPILRLSIVVSENDTHGSNLTISELHLRYLNFAFFPSPSAEKKTFKSNSLNSPCIAISRIESGN